MCPQALVLEIFNDIYCFHNRVSLRILCMCPHALNALFTNNTYYFGQRVSSCHICMCPHAHHAPITNDIYCSGCRVSSRKFACVLTQSNLSTMMNNDVWNDVCPHAYTACVLMQFHRLSAASIVHVSSRTSARDRCCSPYRVSSRS